MHNDARNRKKFFMSCHFKYDTLTIVFRNSHSGFQVVLTKSFDSVDLQRNNIFLHVELRTTGNNFEKRKFPSSFVVMFLLKRLKQAKKYPSCHYGFFLMNLFHSLCLAATYLRHIQQHRISHIIVTSRSPFKIAHKKAELM